MAYRVEITPRAERDLTLLYSDINAAQSFTARQWYYGLQDAIRTLRDLPNRCPTTPENRRLRHLLYGRKPDVYRIIFRVASKARAVEVLHIRHGARRWFRSADLR